MIEICLPQSKVPTVVGSTESKVPTVVGSNQHDDATIADFTQPEKLQFGTPLQGDTRIINSQFNSLPAGKSIDSSDIGEFSPLVRGLLSDTYSENELFDNNKLWEEYLIGYWIKHVGYYDKIGMRYEPSCKEIMRLFGGGILAKSNPDDPGCGRKAAYAEWLLERHGISARIIVAPKFFGDSGHCWIEVPTPFDGSYYIDLSKGIDYIRTEEEYRPRKDNGETKDNYSIYEDIELAIKKNRTKKFAWWTTEWGKEVFKCKGSIGQ